MRPPPGACTGAVQERDHHGVNGTDAPRVSAERPSRPAAARIARISRAGWVCGIRKAQATVESGGGTVSLVYAASSARFHVGD